MSARCFLHFRHARDDNTLAWEAQDEAAALKIGASGTRFAESVRLDADLFQPRAPDPSGLHAHCWRSFRRTRPSLYRQFQNLRSRLSNAEFSVVDGLIFSQDPEPSAIRSCVLRTFRFMARHGLKLSSTAEHQIEEALPSLAANPPEGVETVALPPGNSSGAARGGSPARNAFAAIAHASDAGNSGDRRAGGARLFPPVHGGRTHFRRD